MSPEDEDINLEGIIAKAREHQRKGDHYLAIPHFDSAIDELRQKLSARIEEYPLAKITNDGSFSYIATLFNDRAFSRVMLGKDHYDAAFADNVAALVYGEDRDQKARSLVDMSYIQRVGYNNVPAARNSLRLAAEIATPNSFFHAKALEFEGRTYQGTTEFEKMIDLYGRAVEIYRTLQTAEPDNKTLLPRLGDTAHLLGMVYLDQKDFDKALASQEESLRIHTLAGNNIGIYLATRTSGNVEYQRGNAAAAIDWYTQARAALGPNPPHRNIGSLALNQAQAYLALGNELKAQERWGVFTSLVQSGAVTKYDLLQLQPAVADAFVQAGNRQITLPNRNLVQV